MNVEKLDVTSDVIEDNTGPEGHASVNHLKFLLLVGPYFQGSGNIRRDAMTANSRTWGKHNRLGLQHILE